MTMAPATEARGSVALPAIPVVETGANFPLETLTAHKARADALLDIASRRYPLRALRALDRVSRAWLARWNNAHLDEIDAIAKILDRPGAYFFSVNYEWGCTCRVAPSPDRTSARLTRVLDWLTPGLGSNLVAARVSDAAAGPFALLTWPGYTGVLQVMAPGRFSAALNQAPMRKAVGYSISIGRRIAAGSGGCRIRCRRICCARSPRQRSRSPRRAAC